MPFNEVYRKQAALVVRVLPEIAKQDSLALKGGTGINLFFRDMPRLSVDIDLAYLPVQSRDASLPEIDSALKRIQRRIRATIRGAQVTLGAPSAEGVVTKLLVRADGVQIKVEVSPVLRGCVHPAEVRTVSSRVEEAFGFAEAPVVSFPDIYGGKIVAALDRQHPRDLFDVRDLLRNEGIDMALRGAILVYLISHNRPMFEVLAPARKDLSKEFDQTFEGMTDEPVSLHELVKTREDVIELVVGDMPEEHRRFLVSFERGEPAWSLLGLREVAELPAVKWRQHNLGKLNKRKRAELVSRLEDVLSRTGRR